MRKFLLECGAIALVILIIFLLDTRVSYVYYDIDDKYEIHGTIRQISRLQLQPQPFIIENEVMYIPRKKVVANSMFLAVMFDYLHVDKETIDNIYKNYPQTRKFLKRDGLGNYQNLGLIDLK